MRTGRALALVALCAFAGCRGLSDEGAVRLVRAYDDKLVEAYRTSDEQLMEGLVGPEEGKKLLGLIGVKYDMGFTLDAQLLEFKPLGVRRQEDWVEVRTEERWRYRDRKIGSGETVGGESRDHYFLTYVLKQEKGRWVVWQVRFDQPPEVGRAARDGGSEGRDAG